MLSFVLQVGDKHDLRVFRLTSLWFDNNAKNTNRDLNEFIKVRQSRKFLVQGALDWDHGTHQ